MQENITVKAFNDYKKFRNENRELISVLNDLRKNIYNSLITEEDYSLKVIKKLYEKKEDLKDIAAILSMSEYDVFFIAVENGLIERN